MPRPAATIWMIVVSEVAARARPSLHMRELAVLQRLLTQAVALLEQQEIFLLHPVRGSVQCSQSCSARASTAIRNLSSSSVSLSIPGFPNWESHYGSVQHARASSSTKAAVWLSRI